MPTLQSWPKEISFKCREVELKPLSKGNSRQFIRKKIYTDTHTQTHTHSVLQVFSFVSVFMSFDTYFKFKFYGIYLPNGNGHLLFEDFKDFSSLTNMSSEDRKLTLSL